MDKAAKAIKRSSTLLRSHSDLNLLLIDLDEIRACEKACTKAHRTFAEDLCRWVGANSSDDMKEAFTDLYELDLMWADVRNMFLDNLKMCKYNFDLILESEQFVDRAKHNVASCEKTEAKLKKDVKKMKRSRNTAGQTELEMKLKDNARNTMLAKLELSERMTECDVVKMLKFKTGLKKMNEAYKGLHNKSDALLHAQKIVIDELPDGMESAGSSQESQSSSTRRDWTKARNAVIEAKNRIQVYREEAVPRQVLPGAAADIGIPIEYEAPPPYSPFHRSGDHARECSNSIPGPSTRRYDNCPQPHYRLVPCYVPPSSASSFYPTPSATEQVEEECDGVNRVYVCCNCSARLIAKHSYVQLETSNDNSINECSSADFNRLSLR